MPMRVVNAPKGTDSAEDKKNLTGALTDLRLVHTQPASA
jgi:phenylpyruvate tautomerase PptA (4-oxalocrotonate tautomerase family)